VSVKTCRRSTRAELGINCEDAGGAGISSEQGDRSCSTRRAEVNSPRVVEIAGRSRGLLVLGVEESEDAAGDVVAVVETGAVADAGENIGLSVRHEGDSGLGLDGMKKRAASADQDEGRRLDGAEVVVGEWLGGRASGAERPCAGEEDLEQLRDEQNWIVQSDRQASAHWSWGEAGETVEVHQPDEPGADLLQAAGVERRHAQDLVRRVQGLVQREPTAVGMPDQVRRADVEAVQCLVKPGGAVPGIVEGAAGDATAGITDGVQRDDGVARAQVGQERIPLDGVGTRAMEQYDRRAGRGAVAMYMGGTEIGLHVVFGPWPRPERGEGGVVGGEEPGTLSVVAEPADGGICGRRHGTCVPRKDAMPKRVDHDQRRRHIADALLRVAASSGLHAAGFREVAAEAGVSVRLVQYYFETKEKLLLFGLRRVGEQFTERVLPRLAASALPAVGRARIELVLAATLPLDAESRALQVLYSQYFALALTDPTLATQPYGSDPDVLATWLVDQLRGCRPAEKLGSDQDLADEATAILALTVGLGNAVLAGRQTADDARRVLARHLDHRLGPAGDDLHR
jgi:AcrR family transcriptional regulator